MSSGKATSCAAREQRQASTRKLPFSDWHRVYRGDYMSAALLKRLTRRYEALDMRGESCRPRGSAAKARNAKPKK